MMVSSPTPAPASAGITALPMPPAPTTAIRALLSLLLPDSADLRQDDVPRVAFQLFVGEPHRPVEPKPPAPRLVSLSSATSRKSALSTGAGTSCAIRSPRRTSNGSLPRLARITFTSPR